MFKITLKSAVIPVSLLTLLVFSFFNPLNASEESLTGTTWKLLSWGNSQSPQNPLNQTQITLRFGENRVNGSSGCNRYMASYQLMENRLKIEATAATRMACQGEIMRQESQYLSALKGSQSYNINPQGQLQINYKTEQNSGILTFEPNP